jgi:DNA-directed RNA polymerase specialized sigma24 family protein
MNENDRTINDLHPLPTFVPFVSGCVSPYDDNPADAEQERYSFQYFLEVARSISRGV